MNTKYTVSGSCKDKGSINLEGTKNGKIFISLQATSSAINNDLDIALECLKQAITNKSDEQTIHLEHRALTAAQIPAITFYAESNEKLPVAICIHGLNSSKTQSIQSAIQLAQEGYYTIIIDAAMHGERSLEDPALLDMNMDKEFASNFLYVLKTTANDLSTIIDELVNIPLVDSTRIGVTGTSMGGFITFHAATFEHRISAIAPLVATPDWGLLFEHTSAADFDSEKKISIAATDPLHNYQKMAKTAILVQNNTEDPVVDVRGSRNLDKKLKPLFFATPERYSYIEYNQSGHNVSPEMFHNVIEWFNKFV